METTKCPVCNATIEQGVTICGNCKSHLVWKGGIPKKVASPEEIDKSLKGCSESLSSLGCLATLFVTLPILLLGVCSIV
ncbi:MAG: hypothetical protein EOM15_05655 [Spirochaetia bacterium]|nr:hypothetical protein [Spirochaetia bacterium]